MRYLCCALLSEQSQVTPPCPLSVSDLQGWPWVQILLHPWMLIPPCRCPALPWDHPCCDRDRGCGHQRAAQAAGGWQQSLPGWRGSAAQRQGLGSCQMCSSCSTGQGWSLWRGSKLWGCGTWGHGSGVALAAVREQLDWMTLKVFSSLIPGYGAVAGGRNGDSDRNECRGRAELRAKGDKGCA